MSDTVPDLYRLLRLTDEDRKSDQFDEILRTKYLKLASQCHPHQHSDPQMQKAFRALSDAYDILSQPELRAEYDCCLTW